MLVYLSNKKVSWCVSEFSFHHCTPMPRRRCDHLCNCTVHMASQSILVSHFPATTSCFSTQWVRLWSLSVACNHVKYAWSTSMWIMKISIIPIWWRHQMETFSALLVLCAGNSSVTGEFPAQRPVTQSFGVFFDLRLNKRLGKQSWGWWFEAPSRSVWRHCNDIAESHVNKSSYSHHSLNCYGQGEVTEFDRASIKGYIK